MIITFAMHLVFSGLAKKSEYADVGATPSAATAVGGIINRGKPYKFPEHNNERRNAFLSIWKAFNDYV